MSEITIDALLQLAYGHFKDQGLIKRLMDPCTKLTVSFDVVRGQNGVVVKPHPIKIVKQTGAALADDKPLSESDWTQILSLPEFAEGVELGDGMSLREILIRNKANGQAPYKQAFTKSSSINAILTHHQLCFRMINVSNTYFISRII